MVEEDNSGLRRRWIVDVARWRPSPAQFQARAALLPPHEHPAIHRLIPPAMYALWRSYTELSTHNCRFVKDDDRKRALVSRLLQYSLVHHVLAIPFHRINICRTSQGKPYLQNKNATFPNFNFNTSHQGDYVGIASEPLCLVGLDIVSITNPPQGETTTEFIKNFSSYLTDHGWNCIVHARTPNEMLAEFYRYWCLKEAFVKAVGAGVGFGLHRLEFHHVHWSNISVYIEFSLEKISGKDGDFRFPKQRNPVLVVAEEPCLIPSVCKSLEMCCYLDSKSAASQLCS